MRGPVFVDPPGFIGAIGLMGRMIPGPPGPIGNWPAPSPGPGRTITWPMLTVAMAIAITEVEAARHRTRGKPGVLLEQTKGKVMRGENGRRSVASFVTAS